GLRGVLSAVRDARLAVRAPSHPLDHGAHPRRDRELVRAPLRVQELRQPRRLEEHARPRLRDLRRALPEQPPQARPERELRPALVRARSRVSGDPGARGAPDHPDGRQAGTLAIGSDPDGEARRGLTLGREAATDARIATNRAREAKTTRA